MSPNISKLSPSVITAKKKIAAALNITEVKLKKVSALPAITNSSKKKDILDAIETIVENVDSKKIEKKNVISNICGNTGAAKYLADSIFTKQTKKDGFKKLVYERCLKSANLKNAGNISHLLLIDYLKTKNYKKNNNIDLLKSLCILLVFYVTIADENSSTSSKTIPAAPVNPNCKTTKNKPAQGLHEFNGLAGTNTFYSDASKPLATTHGKASNLCVRRGRKINVIKPLKMSQPPDVTKSDVCVNQDTE